MNKLVNMAVENFRGCRVKKAAETIEREVRVELAEVPEIAKKQGTQKKILQSIMEKNEDGYTRVRKETPGGCTFTRKTFPRHIEDNIIISEKLFEKLFPLGEKPQDKTRTTWNGWEFDVMEDGRVVAEYEMSEGQTSVVVPDYFKVTKVLEPTIQVGRSLNC